MGFIGFIGFTGFIGFIGFIGFLGFIGFIGFRVYGLEFGVEGLHRALGSDSVRASGVEGPGSWHPEQQDPIP